MNVVCFLFISLLISCSGGSGNKKENNDLAETKVADEQPKNDDSTEVSGDTTNSIINDILLPNAEASYSIPMAKAVIMGGQK